MKSSRKCRHAFLLSFATIIYINVSAQQTVDLQQKATTFYTKRQYDSALIVYQQLYQSIASQKASVEKANIQFFYARCLELTGKYKDALLMFRQAEKTYASVQLIDKKWITTQRIASLLDDIGEYNASIETSKLALAHYTQLKDSLQMAFVLHNMGFGYYHAGKIKEALDCHTKEILLLGDKDQPLLARAYNQLGNIWAVDLKDNQQALVYYEKSLAIKLPLNDPGSISASYNNIGITYKDLNQPEKALQNYEMALNYGKKSGVAIQQYNPLINIANLHKRYNRYPEALDAYGKALQLIGKITARQRTSFFFNLGEVYHELGKYDSALHYLQQSLSIIQQSSNYTDLALTELSISKIYASKKDYENAYIHFTKYKQHTDSLYEGDRKKVLAEMMVKYEAAKKDKDLLEANREIEKKEQQQQLLIAEKELQQKENEAALQQSRLNEELANNQRNALAIKAQQEQLIAAQKLNEKQQALIQKETHLRNQTLGLTIAISLLVVLGLLYIIQRKQKKAALKQSILELELAKTAATNKMQEERLRISRELHDNIGSHLTLINATVESMPSENVQDISNQIGVMKNSLVMSMRELRRTVWLMNRSAVSLDELALRLRDYLRPAVNQQLQVQVMVSGNTDLMLSEAATTHLFRIIQEAVNNAIKYAQCLSIQVNLSADEYDRVHFSIKDDGIGFDIDAMANGNGLTNMRYRIKELKGELNIHSKAGETLIEGSFPNPR